VLDFGLAKALAGGEGILSSETSTLSLGTTQQGGYMSPEQARGERTDARTDVWAFGCVLYEMITGHQTFGGTTMTDAPASVIARDPDWKQQAAVGQPVGISPVNRRSEGNRPSSAILWRTRAARPSPWPTPT
jgi:serine/threonine protein kinase